jgi:exonuclease SbcD
VRILPEDDEELTVNRLKKLIDKELSERTDGVLDEHFDYVVLKVKLDKVNNDTIKELENHVNAKNAVLCKIQKIIPQLEVTTLMDGKKLASIDDILNRNPMDTLKEAFAIKHNMEMNEQQEAMLEELLNGIKNETND